MSEEIRARIFDPYYSTKLMGRGLGLAAVQGIILSHGGLVTATSTPGGGVDVRSPAACRPLALARAPTFGARRSRRVVMRNRHCECRSIRWSRCFALPRCVARCSFPSSARLRPGSSCFVPSPG